MGKCAAHPNLRTANKAPRAGTSSPQLVVQQVFLVPLREALQRVPLHVLTLFVLMHGYLGILISLFCLITKFLECLLKLFLGCFL